MGHGQNLVYSSKSSFFGINLNFSGSSYHYTIDGHEVRGEMLLYTTKKKTVGIAYFQTNPFYVVGTAGTIRNCIAGWWVLISDVSGSSVRGGLTSILVKHYQYLSIIIPFPQQPIHSLRLAQVSYTGYKCTAQPLLFPWVSHCQVINSVKVTAKRLKFVCVARTHFVHRPNVQQIRLRFKNQNTHSSWKWRPTKILRNWSCWKGGNHCQCLWGTN